jgi:hypothetical protein
MLAWPSIDELPAAVVVSAPSVAFAWPSTVELPVAELVSAPSVALSVASAALDPGLIAIMIVAQWRVDPCEDV